MTTTKHSVLQAIELLPSESLPELQAFIAFLQFKTAQKAPKPRQREQEDIRSILEAASGLWLARKDAPIDGVDWVNTVRRSNRTVTFVERIHDNR